MFTMLTDNDIHCSNINRSITIVCLTDILNTRTLFCVGSDIALASSGNITSLDTKLGHDYNYNNKFNNNKI